MLRHYIKIATRYILKSWQYSLINIIGLSTGITFSLLIAAYVWSQLQVNTDLKNADRQFLIQSRWKNPNEGYPQATLGPLAKSLKENYPHLVANYYRFDGITSIVSKEDKSFRENIQVGDSTLLSMYGFPLLDGNAGTALNQPYTAVITKDKAIAYFGKTDVVGQSITIENFSGSKHDFKITAVLNAVPKNSVINAAEDYPGNFFVSTQNLEFFGRNMDWGNPFIMNFLELQKGVSPEKLVNPIRELLKQNSTPYIVENLHPEIVSLKEFYLSANNNLVNKMLYILSAIALFILIMAIINFINLSVSRSTTRMREIGLRKVMGGTKQQVILQFLTESVLIVFLASLFAFGAYTITRNPFGTLLNYQLPALTSFPFRFLIIPAGFILGVGIIAGIYPAFVLSSLPSVDSLKGKLTAFKDKVWLRKSLIGFQFATATIVFFGAMIISQQVSLFTGNNLGYNKEYIISAQVPRDWSKAGVNKMENVRNQFAGLPVLNSISLSYEIPDGNNSGSGSVYKLGADSTEAIVSQVLTTDENYTTVYQIPLKAGRFFEGSGLDSGRLVINETAAHALGWKDAGAAIGQRVKIDGDPTLFTVNGVTADFHFGSMQSKIAPIIFVNARFASIYRYLSFKLKPGRLTTSVEQVQQKWSQLLPGTPFEYKFMDDTLGKLYKSELQLKKAAYTATTLALVIALLGVMGLVSLTIQKRNKEIAIRKVLGSSVIGIIVLFIREFLPAMLVSAIIACPVAYIVLQNWLNNYAYRIDLTYQPFVISFAFLALITGILICLQTAQTAIRNPSITLKSE